MLGSFLLQSIDHILEAGFDTEGCVFAILGPILSFGFLGFCFCFMVVLAFELRTFHFLDKVKSLLLEPFPGYHVQVIGLGLHNFLPRLALNLDSPSPEQLG
jgi:hypothetical protein